MAWTKKGPSAASAGKPGSEGATVGAASVAAPISGDRPGSTGDATLVVACSAPLLTFGVAPTSPEAGGSWLVRGPQAAAAKLPAQRKMTAIVSFFMRLCSCGTDGDF